MLHGVDAAEQPVLRRKLRRRQVLELFRKLASTKIGMEACGGAHHWARELRALGHQVVLLPPQYVKPYVKRNKNDAADAEAICEAMSRPRMRFVPVKTTAQQAALMLAGTRGELIRRRTQLSNMIRGYAAEFGLTEAKGLDKIEPLLARITADATAAAAGQGAVRRPWPRTMPGCWSQIRKVEARLMAWHKDNELSRRLGGDSRARPDRRLAGGDEGGRPPVVRLRARLCGLAWPDPDRTTRPPARCGSG